VTQTPPPHPGVAARAWNRLPATVTRPVIVLAWLSFALQIALIGTGGAVRLTASGLGCPTWPFCTATSFVPTPELGIHGVIEFTNRMLTFVLSVVVILVFLVVLRMRVARGDLFVLTLLQGILVAIQAGIGGAAVLTKLSPQVVGVHFFLSCILVALTTVLVWRVRSGPSQTLWAPRWMVVACWVDVGFVVATVILGILTTGSGPHAGDALTAKGLAPRNGLNSQVIQSVHEIPAFATLVFAIFFLIVAWAARDRARWAKTRLVTIGMVAVEIAQIAVGLIQANEGLPIVLVNIHLVLAAILVAAMTALLLSLRGSLESNAGSAEQAGGDSAHTVVAR
jgi:heme a synthase